PRAARALPGPRRGRAAARGPRRRLADGGEARSAGGRDRRRRGHALARRALDRGRPAGPPGSLKADNPRRARALPEVPMVMKPRRTAALVFACASWLAADAADIKEFTLSAGSGPALATVGGDGNIWFAETGHDKIAKITPNGTVTEYATYTSGCAPGGVA